ncbi:hypothetical protein K353_04816 [Kitasatospora sp. SolWspMP-SS2h]|uniref:hypothetical protein n=1 Tax=Kitasatospora sp. SolWspMP-SS2h TaxID=1305729 RepID=UPI000DBA5BEF|nr:hypothetical protein [Kitasatospora sp. SolWspMP-SS2h]RAJ36077.1 hypothetical protein K353_04816 [Kitasatospora sp. SolWspMP-SS2h]
MSDTIDSPRNGGAPSGLGTTSRPAPVRTVHEAYSFACLNCGYGWEQAYDIEHHTARDGRTVVEYTANGVRVPSPLRELACPGCGGERVRIMRAGRVADMAAVTRRGPGYAPTAEPEGPPEPARLRARRHWLAWLRRTG